MKTMEEVLAHHGIRGMKWGVRKDDSSSGGGSSSSSKTIKEPAHPDSVHVSTLKDRAKTSGTKSLSNKELQDTINRMNLERQFSTLSGNKSGGKKFITDQLKQVGKQQVSALANKAAAAQIAKLLAKTALG